MTVVKRTYAMPDETIKRFEAAVPPGRRSALVAHLLKEWVAEQQRQELARAVVEGCREMSEEYLQLEQDFHPLEEEVVHATYRNKAPKVATGLMPI